MDATTITIAISVVAATFWAVLNPVAATTTGTTGFSTGQWTLWGQLNEGRFFHATVELIVDGRLLTIAGNYGPQSCTELFSHSQERGLGRLRCLSRYRQPAAVRLSDGRVLVAGAPDATGRAVASLASSNWKIMCPVVRSPRDHERTGLLASQRKGLERSARRPRLTLCGG
jgi:hypothetical protein